MGFGSNLSLTCSGTRDKSLLLLGPPFCQWQNEVMTQMTSKVIAELTKHLNVLCSSVEACPVTHRGLGPCSKLTGKMCT